MPVRGSKILLVVFILTTILLGCKKKSSDAETARHGGDVVGRTESLTPPDEIPVGWVGDGEIICYALPLYDHVYGLYEYDLSTRLTRCVSKFELGFLEYATMTHDGRFFFYGGSTDGVPIIGLLSREDRRAPFTSNTVFSGICPQFVLDEWEGSLYVLSGSPGSKKATRVLELADYPRKVKSCEPLPLVSDTVGVSKGAIYGLEDAGPDVFLCKISKRDSVCKNLFKFGSFPGTDFVIIPLFSDKGCIISVEDRTGEKGQSLYYQEYSDLGGVAEFGEPDILLPKGYVMRQVTAPDGSGIVVEYDRPLPLNKGEVVNTYVTEVYKLNFSDWRLKLLFEYPAEPSISMRYAEVIAWLPPRGYFNLSYDQGFINPAFTSFRYISNEVLRGR